MWMRWGGWRALVGCAQPGAPLWFLAPEILIIGIKILKKFHSIPRTFISAQNNTMVVLLKTSSVRVSFIQIMQIRVQNKSKSVRKSGYDGDVSTRPSLTFACHQAIQLTN